MAIIIPMLCFAIAPPGYGSLADMNITLYAEDFPFDQGGTIFLKWELPADLNKSLVSSFTIYRKVKGEEIYDKIFEMHEPSETFKDQGTFGRGLDNTRTYQYMVSAELADGRVITSNTASATPMVNIQLAARDQPNDDGGKIALEWSYADSETKRLKTVEILRSDDPDSGFEVINIIENGKQFYQDEGGAEAKLKNGERYYYKLNFITEDGLVAETKVVSAIPKIQYFNTSKVPTFIFTFLFCGLIYYFIIQARRGKDLFIRKMVVIDAMDEAVGRATEMGKPILYISGLSTISDVATIAAINILSGVAKKTAQYDTRLIVPCRDAVVMTVQQEVVEEAYLAVGRPDAYRKEDVFYLTDDQFGYVAAVSGIMVRDKPATMLYMGMFYAESLILAETGASTGAIQIAGTDAVTQLPFFITACDYTLIGEELYAASAYISRDPLLLGSLKGQDWSKIILLVMFVVGTLLVTLGYDFLKDWLTV